MNDMNRRQFLRQATAATAAGAAALTGCDDTPQQNTNSWASKTPQTSRKQAANIADAFGDASITDHHGDPFPLAESFANRPVIVAFGFKDCNDMCMGNANEPKPRFGIAHTLAAMQEEMRKQGKEIPVVLMDTVPEFDQFSKKEHIKEYAELGVRQKSEDGSQIFSIAYGPNSEWVEKLQTDKLGLIQNKGDARQHSPFLVLFSGGKQQMFQGTNNVTLPGVPGLPLNKHAPLDKFQEHGRKIANQILDALPKQSMDVTTP